MIKSNKTEILSVALTLGLVLGVYLGVAASSALFDRDEPRFARATVEMVRSGNFLWPTFNGELRPDKPILIYWLTSVTMRLMGQSELAFRFYAPFGVVATCLLTFLLGRRFFGRKAAFLAMIMIPTTPLVLMVGTAATTDALLLAFISLAIFIFIQNRHRGLNWKGVIYLGLVLGAALLTKGPVGLAVPFLTMITAIAVGRRKYPLPEKRFGPLVVSGIIGIAIFCLWAVPANQATGGEFLSRGLGHHVGTRMLTSFESHGGNFFVYLPYYLVVIMAGFFPWTLYLPAGVSALFGERLGAERVRTYILAWIAPTLILMTLVITKLPHYILPIWPALALVSAGTVQRIEEKGLGPRDLKWLNRGLWFFVPVGLLSALTMMIIPWFSPLNGVRGPIFASGLILLTTVLLGRLKFKNGRHLSCVAVLALGMVFFQINTASFVLPALNHFKVSPLIARQIRANTPNRTEVFTCKFSEPSLIFYLDRPPVKKLRNSDDVLGWAAQSGRAVLVLPQSLLSKIEKKHGSLGLKEIGRAKGFSLGNGKWLELVALERK